jgi:capsular polysaccharide biosynthesis protein
MERERRYGREGSYLAPRPAICRLPGAIVDTACFLICPDECRYLASSVRAVGGLLSFGYSLSEDGALAREVDEVAERDERVVVLGAQSNANYSHWLIESLARALFFQPLDDGSWLYLTPKLKPWQRQTLEMIGLRADRILEVAPSGLARFAEVVAVSRGMAGIQQLLPAAIAALAGLAHPTAGRRRLYVSRTHANVRHVSNEPELVELLARYGFEVVHPQMLPIEDQIRLFAEAEMVAGPHGSGMTGVTFSRPGTLVIELQGEQFGLGGIDYLWNLCALRGHRFAQVVCGHTPGMEHLPTTHRDVTIDVPHLDGVLSSILSG